MPEKPICFVITPIGEDGSDTRKWANQTFKHLIEPVAEKFGFSPLRADQEDRAGIITTHIIQRLVNSELVIADLTNRNPNVFYELAVRHVTRKPLVQMIRADEDIPFDVQGMRTVKFLLSDPDILEQAKEQLARHVEAVKNEDQLDTPISQAVDLQIALESGDPDQVNLAEIANAVQNLTAEVRAQRPSRMETSTPAARLGVALPKLTTFPEIKIPADVLETLQATEEPARKISKTPPKKRKRKSKP
jgi:hypothetical protein